MRDQNSGQVTRHGTLNVRKDENKDMGAALQSPSEVSPEAQTEVKVEFPMSAGGSSFGESERSDLCVVFRGLGDNN